MQPAKVRNCIFISYRRDDARGACDFEGEAVCALEERCIQETETCGR